MQDKIIEIFAFLFGSAIGSFLNVCVCRMPQERYSLIRPGSHCPNCQKPILWYDNIPVISFLLLAGRCRHCKKKISWQYPLVELLTAFTFLAVYKRFGVTLDFLIYAVFLSGLIVATFIDMKLRIIPDEISLGGIVVGLIFALLKSLGDFKAFPNIPLVDSFLGVVLGGALIYGSGLFGNLLFFKLMKRESIEGETESIGGGDVKFLAMIGSFLGWKAVLLTFFLAPFFGVFIGLFVLIYKKSHLIPYGPFLSLAAVISLFFGESILRFLMLR